MNPNLRLSGAPLIRLQQWGRIALALVLAVGCALLVAQVLMSPPVADLRTMAAYLTLTGVGTIIAGSLAVRALDRVGRPSIQTKSLFAALTGSAVALLNVLILARLMFVSTSHDLKLLVALIGFSAVVTAFFSLWVASSTASRLEAIARAVRCVASGGYGVRVDVAGQDQVSTLADDINTLATRLEAMEEQRSSVDRERRELTAAISHDLRTPLASVRAMVEALDDEVVQDRAEVKRYYVTMRREIERLNRMIDDLFELAGIDAGALRLEVHRVSLSEVVAEVVDAMQAQAIRAGIGLTLEVQSQPVDLAIDESRIGRVFANLVGNALEHTPRGGSVSVSVSSEDDVACVYVRDSGEGITPEDLPYIWTRFYRADKSRTRLGGDTGGAGAGLGLAIARGIIESHGGVIDAESGPGRGTTFVVRLPSTRTGDSGKATGMPVSPAS